MSAQEKKQRNRESLLNQGVMLLMTQGYHGTGLKAILDAVQIPKGSFYNYFESKEHFGAEVIQHYINPFIELLDNHLQRNDDALTALQSYFDELIVKLEQNQFTGGCLLGNLMGEIGDSSDLCNQALLSAVSKYRDALCAGLYKAQCQGTVRSDESAEDMADLLSNTWQGALLRMKIEKSSKPLKQCCEYLLGNFFKANSTPDADFYH